MDDIGSFMHDRFVDHDGIDLAEGCGQEDVARDAQEHGSSTFALNGLDRLFLAEVAALGCERAACADLLAHLDPHRRRPFHDSMTGTHAPTVLTWVQGCPSTHDQGRPFPVGGPIKLERLFGLSEGRCQVDVRDGPLLTRHCPDRGLGLAGALRSRNEQAIPPGGKPGKAVSPRYLGIDLPAGRRLALPDLC
jgi:hypothetical protein